MAKIVNGVRFNRRHWQVAELISKAFPGKRIAYELNISPATVKQYLNKIYNAMRAAHPEINGLDMRIVLAHWVAEAEADRYFS